MNIFVGNLSYGVTDIDLRQAFEAHGKVTSASVVLDKMTGKSRGFGFVEMSNEEEGKAAVDALNDFELQGRPIRVNEARPREDRPPRRDGGGGGFRGGDRGGRDGGFRPRGGGGGGRY
ncbi:MAG: RNA-binding protein [Verrucomicrobia bacterium]|mgnify:CR=1 FL=1|nr:RNA-binding protein [Kiritimatiellia bacterium]MCB1100984.1 RNA-binding protein [Kiritimatiellia bacterium]MCP5487587.1 RNA-binding protein [Verrucomicrobiota bacterium]